jgi:hypothetical protein
MKKWIAAGVAVAGLTVFGGAAIAQNVQQQDPTQQQEQTRPDGRDGDCPWKSGGGLQDGQQSSPEAEV